MRLKRLLLRIIRLLIIRVCLILLPESILTIDKSRTHHACSQSNRTFVPAIVMGAQSRAGGGGQEGYNLSITKYRPKIEFFSNGSTDVQHYCGFYVFPKNTGGTEARDILL